MAQIRFKADPDCEAGYYHCISRVAFKRFIFHELEKENFAKIMRLYEEFCQVRVVTFCIVSNHIHVFLRVPRRPGPEAMPGDAELVEMVRKASGKEAAGRLRHNLERLRKESRHEAAEALRERFLRRMWDVSWYMRLLKQRFTNWYNRAHDNCGTLWEGRFTSVLVEGAGTSLVAMATYVDLNPVRARMVQEPEAYRWCGYGEAVAGQALALEGVGVVARALRNGEPVGSGEVLAIYRQHLYEEGAEVHACQTPGGPVPGRAGFTEDRVDQVVAAKGQLTMKETVRCRNRHFTAVGVFGSKAFVDAFFERNRERFGPRCRSGARQMTWAEAGDLYTGRG